VAIVVNISSVAGRRARVGAGVYNATKFAVVAFTESLRQEVTGRHVRVSVVEPGVVRTELDSHMSPENRAQTMKPFAGITALEAEDIAEIITFIVTRNWRSAINEVLVRPTEQAF
jgi:NADP-dependent 3-hydroxy acid dehydrogenase YdfG